MVPRLKNGSDRITGPSFRKGAVFLDARPRINPGGGAGLAINGLSPTSSFEEKGSGIPRDDILTIRSLLGSLGSFQQHIISYFICLFRFINEFTRISCEAFDG